MSTPHDARLEISIAQIMADLAGAGAQLAALPGALRTALPIAIREIDVARLETRRAAIGDPGEHRIAALLETWDQRIPRTSHPLPKPAEAVTKLLAWLWPDLTLDSTGLAAIDREMSQVDARPWCRETVPLARAMVGLERWRALRLGCAMVPGIDIIADLFLMQALMHAEGRPLTLSLTQALTAIGPEAAPADPVAGQRHAPRAVLAALSAEATRTLQVLTSPRLADQLARAMRAALPADVPDALIVAFLGGAVMSRGTIIAHLDTSERQGTRKIARLMQTGWVTADSPKGPLRLMVPPGVLAARLDAAPGRLVASRAGGAG